MVEKRGWGLNENLGFCCVNSFIYMESFTQVKNNIHLFRFYVDTRCSAFRTNRYYCAPSSVYITFKVWYLENIQLVISTIKISIKWILNNIPVYIKILSWLYAAKTRKVVHRLKWNFDTILYLLQRLFSAISRQ